MSNNTVPAVSPTEAATFRRRLLELADVVENATVFNYSFHGDKICVFNDDPTTAKLRCGSAGCALGYASTIPEAFNAGLCFKAYESDPTNGYWPYSSDIAADAFYGLTRRERNYLFYAIESPQADHLPRLTIGGLNQSSKEDVAHAIRAFADWKYPAIKPARKPFKPFEPNTGKCPPKRWIASKLREAAKWIEEHGWIQNSYFGCWDPEKGFCVCAHGGIGAVSNLTCQQSLDAAARRARCCCSAAAAPAVVGAAAWRAAASFGSGCPSYVTEKDSFWVHYFAHKYGCTFAWNDTPGRTKEQVCSQLRATACALEHGGKMPSWAPTEKEKVTK